LKRSTRESYKRIIERHLKPTIGHLRLEAVDLAQVERCLASKRRAGLQPRTPQPPTQPPRIDHGAALRRQLVRMNPVAGVDRPREPRRRWTILSPVEVGRIERAFLDINEDQPWSEQARLVFLTVVGAGLRRGEVLGLRWRDVELADPAGTVLRVRETFVRGAEDTPKSEAGERTIALGPKFAEELWQNRRRAAFSRDGERVFCHPTKGSPLDHKRYAKTLR